MKAMDKDENVNFTATYFCPLFYAAIKSTSWTGTNTLAYFVAGTVTKQE